MNKTGIENEAEVIIDNSYGCYSTKELIDAVCDFANLPTIGHIKSTDPFYIEQILDEELEDVINKVNEVINKWESKEDWSLCWHEGALIFASEDYWRENE